MARYFLDSSALAKLYHEEVGTAAVDQIGRTPGNQICISRLTVVELPSVFAIKVRTQFITRDDARLLVRQFHEDIISGKFEVFAVREPEFALAERLLEQYAFDFRLRTLDAIQIAVAIGLRRQEAVGHFVASDQVLCDVAAREGFSVLNPEHP